MPIIPDDQLRKMDTLERRIQIVLFARQNGIRAACRVFHCSRNTVRYWLRQTEGGYWGAPLHQSYQHRLNIVNTAREKGIKATARLYHCSINTVRKWVRRYKTEGTLGLVDRIRQSFRGRDEDEDYYGRSTRECCPLTTEQRQKRCKPGYCDHWKHCPKRIKPK